MQLSVGRNERRALLSKANRVFRVRQPVRSALWRHVQFDTRDRQADILRRLVREAKAQIRQSVLLHSELCGHVKEDLHKKNRGLLHHTNKRERKFVLLRRGLMQFDAATDHI